MWSEKTLRAFLILVILLLSQVHAQRVGFRIREWQKNKFWWYSSDAPITKALDKHPGVAREAKSILEHLERLETKILSVLRNQTSPKENPFLQPCKSTDWIKWPKAVTSNFGVRGFPHPDLSCVTDFPGVRFSSTEPAPHTVEELYHVIRRYGVNVQRHARSAIAPIVDVVNNFTGPSYVDNFLYNTPRAKCVLHPLNAIRVGQKWRTAAIIQNRPINEFLRLTERQILVEFFRVVDNHLTENALMRLPVRPRSGTERKVREGATTIMISSGGNATPSTFRNIPIEENPAIVEALEIAAVSLDQAQGAITPSNIAILVLPLFLNLLPVTMFANVVGLKMLLYVLLGDVMTVIPLLIKGVELILIREKHNISVVTRMSSSIGGNTSEAAAAEIFAADCQAHDGVRTIGVIYVSLSITFLVVGIILEIAGKRYEAYRKKRRLMKLIWARIDFPASGDSDDEKLMYRPSWDSDAISEVLNGFRLDGSMPRASHIKH